MGRSWQPLPHCAAVSMQSSRPDPEKSPVKTQAPGDFWVRIDWSLAETFSFNCVRLNSSPYAGLF